MLNGDKHINQEHYLDHQKEKESIPFKHEKTNEFCYPIFFDKQFQESFIVKLIQVSSNFS